jgi:hypothetical protein
MTIRLMVKMNLTLTLLSSSDLCCSLDTARCISIEYPLESYLKMSNGGQSGQHTQEEMSVILVTAGCESFLPCGLTIDSSTRSQLSVQMTILLDSGKLSVGSAHEQ